MKINRTILIVEDSDEDYAAINWAWRKAGIATLAVRCKDGEDALDRLFRRGGYSDLKSDEDPGLVLLDLNLPRLNGRSVLSAVKADALLRSTPVVILTSSARSADVDACYEDGANSYIVKPHDLDKLRDKLKAVVSYWMDVVHLPGDGGNYDDQRAEYPDRRGLS